MWTRNYNNLLNTVINNVSEGYNGGSPHPFGDTYTGNYKNTLGNVYEICTYQSFSSSYYRSIARTAFVHRNTSNSLSADIGLLTNTQNVLNNAESGNGWHTGKVLVAFGVSDDEETYDDYRLDDVITKFIQNAVSSEVVDNNDGTLTINYHIMITATDDFVIREIGLFMPVPYLNINGANYSYHALINRMVLGTPISAVTDEVVHVNFSITTPKISLGGLI